MNLLTLTSPPSSQTPQSVDVHSVSAQSKKIADDLSKLWRGFQLLWRKDFFQQMGEAYADCSVPGWDGYSAKPVLREAGDLILYLINQLPLSIQTPEIIPSPSGRLGLEWHTPNGSTLVLEPANQEKLNYVAMLSNGNKVSGTTTSNKIPENILQILFSYFKR